MASPAPDISITAVVPSGPTSITSRFAGLVCVTPSSMTVTFETFPFREPSGTLMNDG